MKTYKEFIEILEQYIGPNETLPGSKSTPIEKAKRKYEQKRSDFKSGKNSSFSAGRKVIKLKKAIAPHGAVTRGADSKNFNLEPNRNIRVRGDREDYMTVHHPDSGVTFDISRTGRNLNNKPVYTVDWRHNKNKDTMSHQDKIKLLHSVKHVWNKHVVHRAPTNTILSNMPTSNSRGNLYKRIANFGSVDSVSRKQLAQVNRNPSPIRRAKGKKRTSPIEGPQQLRRWL